MSKELNEIIAESASPVLDGMGELKPSKGYRLPDALVPSHLRSEAVRRFGVAIPGAYSSESHDYHLSAQQYRAAGGQ